MTFLVAGLDLGQAKDYTAFSVLEVTPTMLELDGLGLDGDYGLAAEHRYRVEGPPATLALRWLERLPLAMPYPDQVAVVAGRLAKLPGALLAVDYTGVGRPVVDLFRALGVPLAAITITGGRDVQRTADGWSTPKRDLVHGLLAAFQQRRLTYARRLATAPTLVSELASVELKINTATGHDSYEAWREGTHDDLVLSVAIAAWLAEQEVGARYEAAVAAIEAAAFTGAIRSAISPV